MKRPVTQAPDKIRNHACSRRFRGDGEGSFTFKAVVWVADNAVAQPMTFADELPLSDVYGPALTAFEAEFGVRNKAPNTFTPAAEVANGRDDTCAEGCGFMPMTMGRSVASANVGFAANTQGIEGLSMAAGDRIGGTGNKDISKGHELMTRAKDTGACKGDGRSETVMASRIGMAG